MLTPCIHFPSLGRRTLAFLAVLIVLAGSLTSMLGPGASDAAAQALPTGPTLGYRDVVNAIDIVRVVDHLRYLSGDGSAVWSRVTGYPGFYQAKDYILSYFKAVGLSDVREERFQVTVPVDLGATIIVLSSTGAAEREVKAYPLWPNMVNPCPYQTHGTDRLVYAGAGKLEEFNGLDVNGSIVLLEFNSRWYWKNAALLGARAVVFIEPDDTSRVEALYKTLSIPYDFPRLLVKRPEGLSLQAACQERGSLPVYVRSMMKWENVEVSNIVGYAYGTEFKEPVIAVAAHYDSWSVVPSLSPGATDALGVSALLESARFFVEHPPKRSLMFVALAAHWQGLWGAREFVDQHFNEVGSKIKLFIDMDLSTDSKDLSVYHQGNSYPYLVQPLAPRYNWIRMTILDTLLPEIQVAVERRYVIYDGITRPIPIFENAILMFDSEPFATAAYGGGLSLHTTNAVRKYPQTTLDTFSNLNIANFLPQLEVTLAILYGLGDLRTIRDDASYPATRFGADWGFTTLTVTVASYNMTTAWFDPFVNPDTLVRIRFYTVPLSFAGEAVQPGQAAAPTMSGVSDVPGVTFMAVGLGGAAKMGGQTGVMGPIDIVMKPDAKGVVKVKGVKPFTAGLIEAYVINSTSGAVCYASDQGFYAFGGTSFPDPSSPSPREYRVYQENVHKYVSVFKCGSIVLLNIVNPVTMGFEGVSIEQLNFISHGPPIWWSQDVFLPEAMLFVQPSMPTEIVVRGSSKSVLAGFNYPIGVLLNATDLSSSGQGYTVEAGQTLLLTDTPRKLLSDSFRLYAGRLSILSGYLVSNPRAEQYNELTTSYLNNSELALTERRYDEAYTYTMFGWSYETSAYASTMDLVIDVINTTVFFFMLLVPFAILIERLLFPSEGMKRMALVLGIIGGCMAVLAVFHPGLRVATNVPIIVIGTTVTILSFIVLNYIIIEARKVGAEVRRKMVGMHSAEFSRTGSTSLSLSFGIQNMRRRRFRTALTLISITVIVADVISFTSVSNITVIHQSELPGTALYDGFLVRRRPWTPIAEQLFVSLKERFKAEAVVATRTWVYPPLEMLSLGPGAQAQAMLGLTPEEAATTGVDRTVIKGRWLEKDDFAACLVSKYLADKLRADLGSIIDIYGMKLNVIGIFNGSVLWDGKTGIVDLDGEAITPMEYVAIAGEAGGAVAVTQVPHIRGDTVVIIPYEFALMSFNALPYSVAFNFGSSSGLSKKAQSLSLAIGTDIYVGVRELSHISIFRPTFGILLSGMELLLVPVIIVAFTLLNVMLSAVYERIREIGIFSAVGVAPSHIAAMFLAESVLYSTISAVSGYLIGIVTIKFFNILGVIPEGFYPNYSSTIIIVVVCVCAATVLSSTLFPASKASRLVTPSLERRWRRPPKPPGDNWHFPLPFVAAESEARGLLAYIREYLEAHKTERTGIFVTIDTSYVQPQGDEETRRDLRLLQAKIWLAPFEAGVRQTVNIGLFPRKEGGYAFDLMLHRDSGFRDTWISSGEYFVDNIRKQFLVWRTMAPGEKQRYVERFVREVQ